MRKMILRRLQPQDEEVIAEQEGFRARRNITEQVFNLRIQFEPATSADSFLDRF